VKTSSSYKNQFIPFNFDSPPLKRNKKDKNDVQADKDIYKLKIREMI
jgi:hypothetical protein